MRIRALGPLLVGDPPATLSPRDRVVVAALAARRGRPCAPEDIAQALWGEHRPETWAKVVQGAVVRIRRALGREAVERGADGYRLVLPDGELDTAAFEGHLVRGRRLVALGEPARALAAFDEAMTLWRGRPFPDLDDWSGGQVEVRRLESLRAEVEEERLAAAVASGRAAESLSVAQGLVTEAPYRERRWELLALTLYAGGRQAEALDAIQGARRTLREDLGLDPGEELLRLERAILVHDPALPRAHVQRASELCPYQGLTAFQPEHHDLFVGRESEVVACLRRLEEHPLLLVVGTSGSGKSSLVRAGVVPPLRQSGREVVVLVPGVDAVDDLRRAQRWAAPGSVLVVDQLEELAGVADQDRAAYLELLAAWTADGVVVGTMRSDRLDLLATSPRLATLAARGLYLLSPLGEVGLRRVVVEPADRVGLLVEPGLPDVLVRDVGERPGALPLLSHALRQTWLNREGDVLTVEGYLATGGIAGAVARTAEAVYAELDDVERRSLRSLLLRLVTITPEGTPLGTRLATGPRTDAALSSVIERLAAHRLVTVEDGSVALSHESLARAWPRLRTWLDDDARWRRVLEHLTVTAAGWAATGRPVAELYSGSRLAAALEWAEGSHPALSADEEDFLQASRAHDADERRTEREALTVQRRRNRRLRTLLGAVATLLVVALAAGAVAVSSRRDAVRAAAEVAAARLGELSAREPRADTALLVARQAVELATTPQTSADLLRAVDARSDLRSVRETGLVSVRGAQPVVSADGARLLALQPEGVVLLDPATGRRVPDVGPAVAGGPTAALGAVGFADDSTTALVTAGVGAAGPGRPCELRRLDVRTARALGPPEPLPGSRCGEDATRDRMRVSPDGSTLVSMSGDTVRWWRRTGPSWQGPRSLPVPGLGAGPSDLRFVSTSDDGRVAAVVAALGTAAPSDPDELVAVVVDLDRGRLLGPVVRDDGLTTAVVSSDGGRLAVGAGNGSVRVRGVAEPATTVVTAGGEPAVSGLAWAKDGRSLYVARADGRTDVVWLESDVVTARLLGHGTGIPVLSSVAFPEGPGLVSLDDSGVLITRSLGSSTVLGARRPLERPHALVVVPGGPVLAGGERGIVAAYDRIGMYRIGALRLAPGRFTPEPGNADVRRRVSAVAATSDGRAVVAGDRTGRLTLWSWPRRTIVWTREDAPTALLAVTPDDTVLVTAELALPADDPDPEGTPDRSWVRLRDLRTGGVIATVETGRRTPRLVVVSPDSRTAVVGFSSGGTEVVDIPTGRVTHTLPEPASAATFTPDGTRLVVVDLAGHGIAYSTTTWRPVTRFPTLATGDAHVLVEPEGRLMFLAGSNGVTVWDAAQLRHLTPRLSLSDDGTGAAIVLAGSPHEPVLAMANGSELVLLDLRESTWRDSACRLANRRLTHDEWDRLLPGRPYEPACGPTAASG